MSTATPAPAPRRVPGNFKSEAEYLASKAGNGDLWGDDMARIDYLRSRGEVIPDPLIYKRF